MDTCERKHTRRLSLTLILWDICFVREAVHAQQKDDLRITKKWVSMVEYDKHLISEYGHKRYEYTENLKEGEFFSKGEIRGKEIKENEQNLLQNTFYWWS